jgi:hypothetical protein
MVYAVPRVTVPAEGQLTDSVAKSPTEEATGLYCTTLKVPVKEGLVADTEPLVGATTTVAIEPNRGERIASTEPAPKSWWKSIEIDASLRPPPTR